MNKQSNGQNPSSAYRKLLDIQNLTLETPTSGRTLISDLSLQINHTDQLLVRLFMLYLSISPTISPSEDFLIEIPYILIDRGS